MTANNTEKPQTNRYRSNLDSSLSAAVFVSKLTSHLPASTLRRSASLGQVHSSHRNRLIKISLGATVGNMGQNLFRLVTGFAKAKLCLNKRVAETISNHTNVLFVYANHAPSSAPSLIWGRIVDSGSWRNNVRLEMRAGAPNSSCPYR